MENYFLLVLLPHLDCFLSGLGIFGVVVCGICAIPCGVVYTDAHGEDEVNHAKKLVKILTRTLIGSIALIALSVPIPSKTEIIQLKAINVLSEIKGVDQIPQKVVDRLNSLLDLVDKENEKS